MEAEADTERNFARHVNHGKVIYHADGHTLYGQDEIDVPIHPQDRDQHAPMPAQPAAPPAHDADVAAAEGAQDGGGGVGGDARPDGNHGPADAGDGPEAGAGGNHQNGLFSHRYGRLFRIG